MPKYTADSLLKKAIPLAIMDRESFIDCHSGTGEWADEARDTIERLNALNGKKLKEMDKDELETARRAFIFAEQYESGLADALRPMGKSAISQPLRTVRLLKEMRMSIWGRTRFEAEMNNSVAFEIFPSNKLVS